MEEYMAEFDALRYHISMHNPAVDEMLFVAQFVRGLKSEIRGTVQGQVPESVERVSLLARVQQQVLENNKPKQYKSFGKQQFSSSKENSKSTPTQSHLWKERQIRDYRKANNLCFYCGEKYDSFHLEKCTKRSKSQSSAQVNALALNDLDMINEDDILNKLAIEDALAADFCQLFLNALAGTEGEDCIRVRALVQNQVMIVLIDSGSTHSFIDSSLVSKLHMEGVSTKPSQVKAANGETLISDTIIPQMEWWAQGHTFRTNMRVLNLGAYDAILGFDWLKQHSPMHCHWESKTLEFRDEEFLSLCKDSRNLQSKFRSYLLHSCANGCKEMRYGL